MQINVDISASSATSHEGAAISLCSGGNSISELYFDFSSLLKAVPQPSDRALDFLLT
jgi:hypothetical protein